ncbi:MAG TPA: hypothetical protein VLT91_00830 [Rhizomicrobium sp.]|nr:hypothetical protein [Rhizomicrobium sp.]
MSPRIYRILFLVIALALTVGVFSLWGEFGRALSAYMAVAYKDEPVKQPPQQKGVVTMTILPPKSACDRDKNPQCPKP